MMKICVIDTGDNNSTDFTKVLKNVNVTLLNMDDTALLQKVTDGVFDGIILTGSTKCVHDEGHKLPSEILDLGVPVLGIGYGFQWMVVARGGVVKECSEQAIQEYDKYIGIAKPFLVSVRKYKFAHQDFIDTLPTGWENLLQQQDQCWVACESATKHLGIQFQPELVESTAIDFFGNWFQWIKK